LKQVIYKIGWRAASVAAGLLVAGLLAEAFGRGAPALYSVLWSGAFGSWGRLLATLSKVAPLLLAGLAVAVPLSAGLFNIGGDGQLYAGALLSVSVALFCAGLPRALLLPLVLVAGVLGGAAWASVAGWLRARRGVHEVIATIMLNFVAFHATAWLVNRGPLADPSGVARTPQIGAAARLPVLAESGTYNLSAALLVALGAALAAWWLVSRTVTGFRFRAVGGNAPAASRKGVSLARTRFLAMAAGGAFGGLAGALELAGVQYSLSAAFSPGYGFDGIAVALVAAGNALAVPFAALLFAAVRAAGPGLQLDAGLSQETIYVIEAVVVIAAAVPSMPPILRRVAARLRERGGGRRGGRTQARVEAPR